MAGRFAVLHPYRGVAENETAQRIVLAAARLGLEAREFADSDAIMDYRPDFVLSISHQDPKLTPFPTYGVLTAPWRRYQTPRFIRNVLSYDAFLTVSDAVKQWLEDLVFGTRKRGAPVGFYANTVQSTPFAGWSPQSPGLAYFGTNWDGNRHGPLFDRLSERPYARFFGPEAGWRRIPSAAYGGSVPFDGVSVLEVYRRLGVGLCLDLPDFAADGLPTNRIFEITAAGAVAICGDNPFVRRWFGDSVLYVDPAAPPEAQLWQIDRHMAWIGADPARAAALARDAHRRFAETLALERLLPNVLALHEEVSVRKGYAAGGGAENLPSIGCIVRTGGRSEAMLRRALESLRAQRCPGLRVFLVVWARAPWLDTVLADFGDLAVSVVDRPGSGRSASLWAGLAAVRAAGVELFGILDDDDELFPNHYRSLIDTLRHHDRCNPEARYGLAYSACVEVSPVPFSNDRIQDDSSLPYTQRRRIQQFHFHPPEMLNRRSFVCASMTFLARTALLTGEVLEDPGLEVAEDLYLWLLLAERTRFAFSCEVTSACFRHGEGQSDYDDPERFLPAYRRIFYRMFGRSFPQSVAYTIQGDAAGGEGEARMDGHLFAAVPVAPAGPPDPPTGFIPATPRAAEGVLWHDGALVVPADRTPGDIAVFAVPRLPVGAYRADVYVAACDAEPLLELELVCEGEVVASGPLRVAAPDAGADLRRLEGSLAVLPRFAMAEAVLRLRGLRAGALTVVALALRCEGDSPRCRIGDLPRDRPVWIHGAGEGGRIVLARLEQAGGFRIAGFIDRSKHGSLLGHPVVPLATALEALAAEEASIILASQYWRDMEAELAGHGVRNVYCAHPFDRPDLAILR